MEWISSVGIAAVVIGVIISAIKKVVETTKKTTNNNSNSSPSAPKSGGEDFFGEIKSTAAKKAVTNQKIPQKKGAEHMHPATERPLRVEKAAVEDSMGEFQSEGCAEHYYDRFVAIPEKPKNQALNEELVKIIVLGEVLNNPGFKKNRRK